MTRNVFPGVDDFADALAGTIGRFIATARSTAEWWTHDLVIGCLRLQMFQVGGPATFAGDGKRSQIALQIPLSNPRKVRVQGRFFEQGSFLLIKEAQPFTFTTLEASRWLSIALPSDHLLLRSQVVKSQLSLLLDKQPSTHVETTAQHLNRIRSLADRLFGAAGTITSGVVADGSVRDEVMATVSRILETSSTAMSLQRGRPAVSRTRIILGVLALIEASAGTPLSIDDLCRASGVAERTLRSVFHAHFGVGPMRLLRVRQLREIREALLAADPTRDTVTSIAGRLGVWDFSLFARNYKALFGEPPSHTLRRTARLSKHHRRVRNSWLHYAAHAFSTKSTATS
jgi:AraC-like DNA-binding protein